MIVIQSTKNDASKEAFFMVILEPRNISDLVKGIPIHKDLHSIHKEFPFGFAICFTPDIKFVAQQIREGTSPIDAVYNSLERIPVFAVGDGEELEILRQAPDPTGAKEFVTKPEPTKEGK